MTHDQLQNDLASHLRAGTDRMVWTNTQLGPVGSPRPDVFTVNKSFSRFRTDCYEIKVSVSDLRSDITSGKWQSYRKFGHCVWFAFPRGMAPLDLIPKECGVILRSEAGWRAARKPVAQVLDTLPRDTWLKLLMDGPIGPTDCAPRNIHEWTMASLLAKKMGKESSDLFDARRRANGNYALATAKLQASADEINAEVKRLRENALRDLERQRVALDESMKNLGVALGLEYEAVDADTLTSKLRQLSRKLGGSDLVRAIDMLTTLQGVLKEPVTVVGAQPMESAAV